MRVLPILLVALFTVNAKAGDACENQKTTIEIDKCAQVKYHAKDKRLNLAYQDALKRIDSWLDDPKQRNDTKNGLVEAQRLWIQFRDKDCGAVYDLWRDGTIRGAMFIECMSTHTERRTKDLDAFATSNH